MGSSKSLAVLAAGAALVVSGCTGGEPEADPTPILPESSEPADPSPSDPSESETADVEAPEMPDAARERSFEGAEAFVEYWAETFTHAMTSGDVAAFDDLSAEGCESCSGSSAAISDLYGGGGRIETDGWEVERVAFAGDDALTDPVVRMSRGRETVFSPGEPTVRNPANVRNFEFSLEHGASGWTVLEFTLLED